MDELTSLARAAGRGDRAALASFVRETQGDVWRLCAYLVDPAAADDLAQDTYLRAIPALRRFRGDAPVRAAGVSAGTYRPRRGRITSKCTGPRALRRT